MASKIQLRRDSSGNWSATNPVLAEGEMGVELDTNRSKLGDGTSNWNDIDYMTDTNAVGTYDANYLIKNRNVGDQTVVSTGTTTFNGLVAAGSGVKVTPGGTQGAVVNGLYNQGDDELRIAVEGRDSVWLSPEGNRFFVQNLKTEFISHVRTFGKVESSGSPRNYSGFVCNAGTESSGNYVNFAGFAVEGNQFDAKPSKVSGFLVNSNVSSVSDDVKGVEINLFNNTNIGGQTYSLFTAGPAPNFFAGNTYIGGTASRSTRELWESTLTEDQKEQLAAGTLAIPANVSTPGDGSFVRQWWYNQQSAEDQALIDAGELEYPEHYRAANFVDTFSLDQDTAIQLKSGGQGQFKSAKSTSLIVTGSDFSNELFANGASSLPGIDGFNGVNLCAKGERILGVYNTGSVGVSPSPQVDVNGFSQGMAILTTPEARNGGKQPNDTARNVYVGGQAETTAVDNYYGVVSSIEADSSLLERFEAVHVDDTNFGVSGRQDIAKMQIGVLSDFNNSSNANVEAYNFFAAGDAPNYFLGQTNFGRSVVVAGQALFVTPDNILVNDEADDKVGLQIGANGGLISSISETNNTNANLYIRRLNKEVNDGTSGGDFIVFVAGSNGHTDVGRIATTLDGTSLRILGADGQPLILDEGADPRNVTSTEALSNASAVVQQLNPVRINNKRSGFTAADLEPLVPEAVSGTAGATEAIGTLYDFDGTVLETEVTEPPAEAQSYVTEEGETRVKSWTQTGTRPIYQGVDQTKLIPLLCKALQEALDRIEELESGSGGGESELESRLSTLEADMARFKAI